MAIGWLTVLQSVPWSDVISNAPKVADGAKKLWNAVSKKSSSQEASDSIAHSAGAAKPPTLAELEARANALEAELSDLQQQMLKSSELIKSLADQNAQLIQRIEANRVRVLWLSAATSVVAIATLSAVFLALSRQGV